MVSREKEEVVESVVRESTHLYWSQYKWPGELEHVKLLNLLMNVVEKCIVIKTNVLKFGQLTWGWEDVSEPDHALSTGTDRDQHMLTYYEILIKEWSASGWRDDEKLSKYWRKTNLTSEVSGHKTNEHRLKFVLPLAQALKKHLRRRMWAALTSQKGLQEIFSRNRPRN